MRGDAAGASVPVRPDTSGHVWDGVEILLVWSLAREAQDFLARDGKTPSLLQASSVWPHEGGGAAIASTSKFSAARFASLLDLGPGNKDAQIVSQRVGPSEG